MPFFSNKFDPSDKIFGRKKGVSAPDSFAIFAGFLLSVETIILLTYLDFLIDLIITSLNF